MDRASAARFDRCHPRGQRALILSCVASALMVLAGETAALWVGSPLTQSSLGQPLNLLFPLRLAAGETLDAECVQAEVLAGDGRVPAAQLLLRLEGEGDNALRAVRLRSQVQIDEPIIGVSLSVGCPTRFTRQYTAFVDPADPHAPSAPAEPPGAEPGSLRYTPALRAALSMAEAKPPALLAGGAAPASALQLPTVVAEPAPIAPPPDDKPARRVKQTFAKAPTRPAEVSASTAAPAGRRGAARLQLEPPEVLEELPPGAAAPASSPELDAALTRLQRLEDSLARVQQEHRGTQDKLQMLRAQLEQAHNERYRNPPMLALIVAVLALSALCAYLWRARARERELRESAWWDEVKSEQRESRLSQPGPAPLGVPPPAIEPPGSRPIEQQASAADGGESTAPTVPAALAEPAGEPLSIQFLGAAPPLLPLQPVGDRPVTVEELIDLEQRVDFFQVLGQDEAASELLHSRIDTGTASALPYLKLLEIQQRRGDEAGFAELAERFAERFEALPPTWGADMNQGRHLEAYPMALRRLQHCWHDSGVSMALLQSLLSHGGEAGCGFDLPAYHDLLMLYGVARDLSEHEVRGEQIDLFLPLDAAATRNIGNSMMATMVWQSASASLADHIDVDLSLEEPAPGWR